MDRGKERRELPEEKRIRQARAGKPSPVAEWFPGLIRWIRLIAAQALGTDAEIGFFIVLPVLVPSYLIFAKIFPGYVSQSCGCSFTDTAGLIAQGIDEGLNGPERADLAHGHRGTNSDGDLVIFQDAGQGFDSPGRLGFSQGFDGSGPDTFLLVLQEIKKRRYCCRVPCAPSLRRPRAR